MKIIKSRITNYPKCLTDPMPSVYVIYEDDGPELYLFDFYPDEISFSPDEFIGLTKKDAINLKFKKDKKYLQS